MIDFNKMDDKDFVFINKTLNEKEEKDFSAFLKSRKTIVSQVRVNNKVKTATKQLPPLI